MQTQFILLQVDQCQRVYPPEYVGVAEPVHELHLSQHVGFVAGQRVHLQRHHLPRDPVLHLENQQGKSEPR